MPKIFESDSESETDIKIDNDYAKNYDQWRQKEELYKLKTKYGDALLEDLSSSSSDDDEVGAEITEEVEKDFFKTLSYLKNKDPRIYDGKVQFFKCVNDQIGDKKQKKKKDGKPMYINDYERELILTGKGDVSDSDDSLKDSNLKSTTYVEEQNQLKENFKRALNTITEDDEEDLGGMLKKRDKSVQEKVEEEKDYKEWLSGQKKEIHDKEFQNELKPLKDYWNNPNLDDGEKFLKDYILNKRFLRRDDANYVPTYDEIIHDSDKDLSEDENAIQQQEEFEHKYNFRFEEPDQDFIKRFPRTMAQTLRKSDDRRKIKRQETKERKQKEKEEKMQDLKKLQELKKKEIEDKIQKLREITGNDDIKFQDEDLEEDFDPEAHDKKMSSLFNDDYYQGQEGEQKPEFPDIDEYLDLENWEKWKGDENDTNNADEPHCEDENFNMDCDYDPTSEITNELIENSKGKKKRKRKSLFSKAVSKPKPVFDPKDKTYGQYLDEYYKFDCEDIIGDIPCKFKYRNVVPNDFGLTIEEILTANDRELNKWCSIKKAVQHRPEHIEKYDQIAYQKKASNFMMKKKILPSLFIDEEESEEHNDEKKKKSKIRCKRTAENSEMKVAQKEDGEKSSSKKLQEITINLETSTAQAENSTNDIKNEKKKRKKKRNKVSKEKIETDEIQSIVEEKQNKVQQNKKKNFGLNAEDVPKKKRKFNKQTELSCISDARLAAYGINPKKFKNKLKYKN